MITVVLIGNDGSGKTTISNRLIKESSFKLKYMYMGTSIQSSNYALPWSRFANWIKKRNIRKKAEKKGITDPSYLSIHHIEHRRPKSSNLRTLLRVTNRMIEAGYRFLITSIFKLQGYHILFDRYFLFEVAPKIVDGKPIKMNPIEDVYFRMWRDVIPHPNITIFLDAPSEVLIARKGEGTVKYFDEHRDTWMYIGAQMENFYVVDVTQSIDDVYQSVVEIISQYLMTQD